MKELLHEFELLLQVIGDESLSTEERISAMERVNTLYPIILEYQKEVIELSNKIDTLAEIVSESE